MLDFFTFCLVLSLASTLAALIGIGYCIYNSTSVCRRNGSGGETYQTICLEDDEDIGDFLDGEYN